MVRIRFRFGQDQDQDQGQNQGQGYSQGQSYNQSQDQSQSQGQGQGYGQGQSQGQSQDNNHFLGYSSFFSTYYRQYRGQGLFFSRFHDIRVEIYYNKNLIANIITDNIMRYINTTMHDKINNKTTSTINKMLYRISKVPEYKIKLSINSNNLTKKEKNAIKKYNKEYYKYFKYLCNNSKKFFSALISLNNYKLIKFAEVV